MFIAAVPHGLDQNPEVKQLLGKLKRTVEQRKQEARWTPASLWHVSLEFLGDSVDTVRARSVLDTWRPPALVLRLRGLGAFPSVEEGRVLWMGVQENQELLQAQSQLGQRLRDAGFAADQREYKPHLTLARFRNLSNLSDLVDLGGRKRFGDYPIREWILFESVLQGNILKYVPVHRVGFFSDSDSAPTK